MAEKNLPATKRDLMPIVEPKEVINKGIETAKALKTMIIDSKTDRKRYGKNKEIHIEFSEWQAFGNWYNIDVETHECGEVTRFGQRGIKAWAEAIDLSTGQRVGYAEASCFKDEPGRGNHTWNQIGSMAQTRAGSKALKNALGWIVELAGLSSTPAEEMNGLKSKEASDEEIVKEVNNEVDKSVNGKETKKEETEKKEETPDTEQERKEILEKRKEEIKNTEIDEEKDKGPIMETLDATDDLTRAEIRKMSISDIGRYVINKLKAKKRELTGAEFGKEIMPWKQKRWISGKKYEALREWFLETMKTET